MSVVDTAPAVTPEAGRRRPPAHRAEPNWRAVGVAVAITLVALLPVITVLIQRWGRVYVPVGDQATLDLRIRDVWSFSSDTPLTGPYSRFGWNHPGPMMYYLLAVFSGMARQPAWASLVGNVLLQGLAVVWTARLSWKAGGLRWMIPWLAVLTLSYWATGPWIFQQLWNPYLPFPFFTLLLLQAWLVGSGDARRLLGMAFVGSFLIQAHVSYALPVLAVSLWAVVRLLVAEHRAGRSVHRWSLWWPPLVVLAAMWFVPLVVDTALHFPGNTVHLVEFYLGLDGTKHLPRLGIQRAAGYLAAEFRWRPPWLGGADPPNHFTSLTAPSPTAYLLLPVVLIGASWVLARWRRRTDLVALAQLLAVVVAAAVVALAVLNGPPFPYLFYWRIPIGAATVVMGLVVLVDTLPGPRRPARAVLCCLLAAGVAVASVSLTRTVAAADGPVAPMEPVAASIIGQLRAEGQPHGKVLLRGSRHPARRPPRRVGGPAGQGGRTGLGGQGARLPVRRQPDRSALGRRVGVVRDRGERAVQPGHTGSPAPASWPGPTPCRPPSRLSWWPCSASCPTSSPPTDGPVTWASWVARTGPRNWPGWPASRPPTWPGCRCSTGR